MTPLSKVDEKPKPSKLIMFALLNAHVKVGVWVILFALSILMAVGGSHIIGGPLVVGITRDDPLFSFIGFVFRIPVYALPVLSVALIPARESQRWQVIALIAMLLNSGLMLLSALFIDTAFFIPMVGYLVSAVLVVLVLSKRRNV